LICGDSVITFVPTIVLVKGIKESASFNAVWSPKLGRPDGDWHRRVLHQQGELTPFAPYGYTESAFRQHHSRSDRWGGEPLA
jgi:hypothetical protein